MSVGRKKISVAMAAFNGEDFILDQLKSIANQTVLPDEIVICDDGSNDATVKILEEFAKHAQFDVKIILNDTRIGLVKNFEKAISHCSGEYIFLSDQDDVWFKNKISAIIKVFESSKNTLLVIHDCIPTDSGLNPTVNSLFENTLRLHGRDSELIMGCCTSFRRSLMDLTVPFPNSVHYLHCHDGWLHYASDAIDARLIHSLPLMFYRRHDANTSGSIVSHRKMNYIDRIISHIMVFSRIKKHNTSVDRRLSAELEGLSLLQERISVSDGLFALNAPSTITTRLETLHEREKVRKMNVICRIYPALRLLVSGGYVRFSGYKSLIVDMLK